VEKGKEKGKETRNWDLERDDKGEIRRSMRS